MLGFDLEVFDFDSSFLIPHSAFGTPGGEIESRLAYTQKSEGQNLPGRPVPSKVQCPKSNVRTQATKNKHRLEA